MEKKKILKRIIITGTHLTPAIELINQLKTDSQIKWDIFYIGRLFNSATDKIPSIESSIIPQLGIKFYPINSGKFDRKFFWNNFFELIEFFKGFFDCLKIISIIKPDFIVSFGGYVSVLPVIIGFFKKIPSITHEQTPTISLTTKINSFFVKKIALSFENTVHINSLPKNKIIITGNLLRSEIYNQNSLLFINKFKAQNSPIIYVTAGNQGSQVINKIILKIKSKLKNFIIVHQTGQKDFEKIKNEIKNTKNYFAFDYINLNDIGWILNKSDIIISRSGANTSQEIVALNKKSILIPMPKSQQNEQKINASWVKNQLPDQTIIIPQEKLNSKIILESIKKLSNIKTENKKNNIQTNKKIINLIHEII